LLVFSSKSVITPTASKKKKAEDKDREIHLVLWVYFDRRTQNASVCLKSFRKIHEPKKNKVIEQFRTLHNEEYRDLHRPPLSTVRVLKYRMPRRAKREHRIQRMYIYILFGILLMKFCLKSH